MTARLCIMGSVALLCALVLQGCNLNVPRHTIGNWEAKPNYLTEFQWVMPGQPESKAILNSCSDPAIGTALQCNGHGRCKDWNDVVPGANSGAPRLAFCDCDRDWAGPECTTSRKSQLTAFVLSLFLGVFGVDQFYLGYPLYGVFKLATLGGAGLWYLYDLCRIGSSPVVTRYNFRVAADLPHFAFVLTVVTAMLFLGFVIAIRSIQNQRVKKAHELMLLRMDQEEVEEEKEEKAWEKNLPAPPAQPQYSMAAPPTTVPLRSGSFSGYGSVIPRATSVPLTRPVPSTLPPVVLPPTTRSVTPPPMVPVATLPPMTLPPAAPVTTAVSAPITTAVSAPVTTSAPEVMTLPPMTGQVTSFPSSTSMPLTEYSVPRAVASMGPAISPTNSVLVNSGFAANSVTSPVLPVGQGAGAYPTMPPSAVSSSINMPSMGASPWMRAS